MNFLVKWSELSIEYWVIIGLSIIIVLLILFLLLVFSVYKRKKFKFKINDIVSDNLIKIGKKNYKFSSKNSFALFNQIKSIVLDKRYKYFYKFKKRYKEGNLNNELFDVVKKYYLKNEKELNKKPQNLNVDTKKIDNYDVSDNSNKKIEPIFDDKNMTVKFEEEK